MAVLGVPLAATARDAHARRGTAAEAAAVAAAPSGASASPEARTVFVAVPAGHEADAGAAASVPPGHVLQRLDRRTREVAVALAALALPPALAAVAAALACALALWDASAALGAWAAGLVLVAAGCAALPWRGRHGRRPWAGRRWPQLYQALALLLLAGCAALPWWPGAPARALLLAALGAVGVAGAAAFAPLATAGLAAVAVPLAAAAAEWWRAGAVVPPPAAALAGLAAALAAAAVAGVARAQWRRLARGVLAQEERVAELEAARDEARRADQEKSRFLAIASHDLRQPVHALGLFAATLEKRLQGAAEEPLVRNMVRSIDGLDRAFNAMLDVSRLDAGTVEPNRQHFPLRDLFRRLHMHFAGQAEQAGLGLRFAPGGKSVTSDPQLLERILGNLIQNAIKYTERGGIAVVARSTETHFHIEVWDTGIGIRGADLPRIFDEFYQVGRGDRTRAQGLGMGLAIVKRLARLLGHSLTVASQPGRGTMFRIGVPIGGLAEIQDATAAADTLPLPVLQPRTVLVIDDEAAIREGLGLLLGEWGYQVVAAGDVEQATRMLRTLDAPPDLILSDLHLGDGPDGIAAIDAVRAACGADVPAILVTGDTSHDEMRRATDSGHPVLFKPVQPRKLLNAMRGLVS